MTSACVFIGNFGFVFKGQWKDELVAIKTVQGPYIIKMRP